MPEKEFKDHFSRQSTLYAQSRPTYPKDLFSFIASLAPSRELAWDCATGNGQAAVLLTDHFDRVVASDASANQITKAFEHARISYAVAQAEESGLDDTTIDLITCASGIHWFDIDAFYLEAHRVLKPDGILALWCYAWNHIDDEIDVPVRHLGHEVLKDYWPKENQLAWNRYRDLVLPFDELEAPVFKCTVEWNMNQLTNYFLSWSASQNYIDATNTNPINVIKEELEAAWGDPEERKTVTWGLCIRIGRKTN